MNLIAEFFTFCSGTVRNSVKFSDFSKGQLAGLFGIYYRINQGYTRYVPGINHNSKNLVYPWFISGLSLVLQWKIL
jgi:hypothetical protein